MSLTRTAQTLLITAMAALPALAQDGIEEATRPAGLFDSFFPIVIAMIAIIYFIMIRPEQKRQKQRQAMLSALKKGDRVLTIGGIVGEITAVKDTTYVIRSGEGTSLEVTKSAVQSLMGDANKDAGKDAGAKESK